MSFESMEKAIACLGVTCQELADAIDKLNEMFTIPSMVATAKMFNHSKTRHSKWPIVKSLGRCNKSGYVTKFRGPRRIT